MKAWIQARLTRDAGYIHLMWSARISLVWACVCGVWVALPAFQSYLDPRIFVCLCVFVSILVTIAHMVKQKDIPNV